MSSHKKAAAAQGAGKFKAEIVPVRTKVRDTHINSSLNHMHLLHCLAASIA